MRVGILLLVLSLGRARGRGYFALGRGSWSRFWSQLSSGGQCALGRDLAALLIWSSWSPLLVADILLLVAGILLLVRALGRAVGRESGPREVVKTRRRCWNNNGEDAKLEILLRTFTIKYQTTAVRRFRRWKWFTSPTGCCRSCFHLLVEVSRLWEKSTSERSWQPRLRLWAARETAG
jgi:hypothetical protein